MLDCYYYQNKLYYANGEQWKASRDGSHMHEKSSSFMMK